MPAHLVRCSCTTFALFGHNPPSSHCSVNSRTLLHADSSSLFLQVELQPSPETFFSSSHSSGGVTLPSPQMAMMVQSFAQASSVDVLPSSHASCGAPCCHRRARASDRWLATATLDSRRQPRRFIITVGAADAAVSAVLLHKQLLAQAASPEPARGPVLRSQRGVALFAALDRAVAALALDRTQRAEAVARASAALTVANACALCVGGTRGGVVGAQAAVVAFLDQLLDQAVAARCAHGALRGARGGVDVSLSCSSSHCSSSPKSSVPSPQKGSVQLTLQPSPSVALPSSHSSTPS